MHLYASEMHRYDMPAKLEIFGVLGSKIPKYGPIALKFGDQ